MNINVNYNDTTDQIKVRKETMTNNTSAERQELVREAWREYCRRYRTAHPEAVRRNNQKGSLRNQKRNYERRVGEWEAVLADAVIAITDTTPNDSRTHEVALALARQYVLAKPRRTSAQIAADKGETTEGGERVEGK